VTASGSRVHAAAEAALIGDEPLTLIPAAVVEALAEHTTDLRPNKTPTSPGYTISSTARQPHDPAQ
jgi:hypothetical protein